MFLDPKTETRAASLFERLQKHFTKRVSLGSPNTGSKSEGKILAHKKTKGKFYRV